MTIVIGLWQSLDEFPLRTVIVAFLCVHPLGSALVAVFGAVAFRRHRDSGCCDQ